MCIRTRTGCRHICLLGGLWPANLAFYPQVLKFTGGFIWNCPRIRFHPLDPCNQLVSTVWTPILSWIVFQITSEVSFVAGICEYVKYLRLLCWCYWWIGNGKYFKASSFEKVGRLTLTLSNMLRSSSSICLFNAPCVYHLCRFCIWMAVRGEGGSTTLNFARPQKFTTEPCLGSTSRILWDCLPGS